EFMQIWTVSHPTRVGDSYCAPSVGYGLAAFTHPTTATATAILAFTGLRQFQLRDNPREEIRQAVAGFHGGAVQIEHLFDARWLVEERGRCGAEHPGGRLLLHQAFQVPG